nr:hypothetical protein [Streptomyces spiramyceticus]
MSPSSSTSPTYSLPARPAPPPCGVPGFAPVRVRGGMRFLRRAVRRRKRAMAGALAMAAAALAASGVYDTGRTGAGPAAAVAAPQRERKPVEMVSAPVRIADAATVRLLRRGDRVDVIAAANASAGGARSGARVVAAGARVAEVPKAAAGTFGDDSGALVVLSVPRNTAAELAGAGTTSQLAVTLC